MKNSITSFLLVLAAGISQASLAQTHLSKERILKDETNNVTVTLTKDTVRCSNIGYSNLELKVSVPDLDYLAIFNHANVGEALPCMSAGKCVPGNNPIDIIIPGKDTEQTDIRVQLVEILDIDLPTQKCNRTLEERVSAQIRGKAFRHVHSADIGSYPINICNQL